MLASSGWPVLCRRQCRPRQTFAGKPHDERGLLNLHAYDTIRRVFAGGLLIACLSTGCAGQGLRNAFPGKLSFAGSKVSQLSEILQDMPKLPAESLRNELQALYASTDSEQTRREAAYMLGRLLQKTDKPEDLKQALSLFQDAQSLSDLSERCQWHISECAVGLGQEKTVRNALHEITEKAASDETKAAAQYGLAQSYLRAGENEEARETFSQLRQSHPQSNYALGATYYLAEMDIDKPAQREGCLKLFRQYLEKSPDGHFARNILARLSSLPDYRPTKADLSLLGQVHYVHGEWQDALSDWQKSGTDKHWFEMAASMVALKQSAAGKEALLTGIKEHPTSESLPQAARLLCQLLTREEAMSFWKNLLATNPKYASLSLWNLAVRCEPPQSVAYYNALLSKYGNSEYAPEAAWWVSWDQIQHGKLRPALSILVAAEKKYPSSKAAARFAFWQGKIHEALGEKEAARQSYNQAAAHYSANYYGWRAHARAQAITGGKDSGWTTVPGRKHPDESWSWPELSALISSKALEESAGKTVALLVRLHQWEEALEILPVNNQVTRAFLLARLNLPLDAINTVSATLSTRPCHDGHWQMSYPLLYADSVSRAAADQHIDPLLVHALIREESRYNPSAVSSSNAFGLMQLLPSTARGIASKTGVSVSDVNDILKPSNNLRLGAYYLSYVISRHEGNALLGVASYNGGPNAALAWSNRMKRQQSFDWDYFVENIPFRETRDYVRKVFGSYWCYQSIYCSKRGGKA